MTYFEYLLGKTPDGAKRAFGVILTLDNDEKVLKNFQTTKKRKVIAISHLIARRKRTAYIPLNLTISLKRKTESKKQGLRASSNTDEAQIRVNLIKK